MSPGVCTFDLSCGEAVCVLSSDVDIATQAQVAGGVVRFVEEARARETRRRKKCGGPLDCAADQYIVRRGEGRSIVAGYPWFTDYGRDTFIAIRGLCLATGRLSVARDILLAWGEALWRGAIPNRFPEIGYEADYNSADASLWHVIAIDEYLAAMESREREIPRDQWHRFRETVESILNAHSHGAPHGVWLESDDLLASGRPGDQLTWMDAKVGDWAVTPRVGKPVEIQALWLRALQCGLRFSDRWQDLIQRGRQSFARQFWNEDGECLFDVVDVDHVSGQNDATVRPNQVFALGALGEPLVDPERARLALDRIELALWTPMGLRTLPVDDAKYIGRYEGSAAERDTAFHQGVVWPWLTGPFVEAWVKVRGDSADVRREARRRFLNPLFDRLEARGINHISEIADGDPPHSERGCPFQAWSLAELIRLDCQVLAENQNSKPEK